MASEGPPRKVSVIPGCPGSQNMVLKGRETASPPKGLQEGHKSLTKALGRSDSEFSHTFAAQRSVIIHMSQMKKSRLREGK